MTGIMGAVTKGRSAWMALSAGFANSAAAASGATGIWGVAGGKIRDMAVAIKGWSVWSKIAAAATKVWAGVMVVFNLIMDANPIALVVLAIVALIAIFVVLWVKCKWFRDFWKGLWHGIVDVDKAAWNWIQNAAGAVWNWLKQNWPLLLGIITGPIGLAAALIFKYWDKITAAAKFLWGALKTGFDIVWGAIKTGIRILAGVVLGWFGDILHGAKAMLGWVPWLKGPLNDAVRQFDAFHKRIMASLTIHPPPVALTFSLK